MKDFKGFIFYNNISQKDVIDYLGVSKGYMSLVVSGKKQLSEENLRKLLENPYGWDVSMLLESEKPTEQTNLVAKQIPQLSNVEILLRDLLAEERAKIDSLQDRINELIEENARLKTLLERKGGDAQSADSSFVADAI